MEEHRELFLAIFLVMLTAGAGSWAAIPVWIEWRARKQKVRKKEKKRLKKKLALANPQT